MARSITTRGRRRAIVIIEFAIALPLLLVLVFGVVELGWAILKSQQITNAARQGARVGARIDATNADVNQAIQAMMDAANMGSSGFVVTLEPGNIEEIPGGQQFTVTLTVSYANVGLGMPFVPVPTNLVAHVTMAKEGF